MNQDSASRVADMTTTITDTSALQSCNRVWVATTAGERQPWWRLLSYGGLSLPVCLAGLPILTYLPAFYAKEMHLSAGLVGLVFLSVRLWDGLADILIGWLSDRSMSRFGRRKPWVVVGVPFLMVSTWFLCNPPANAGLIYLVIWAGLFYTAWTAVYIPYVSWGTELASEYVERTRVTSFRETFNMLGNLLFATGPLVFLAADALLHDVLFLISITAVGLMLITAFPLARYVRDPPPVRRIETHLLNGLSAVMKDRVLIRLAIVTLLTCMSNGVVNSLAVFSFSVGLQLPNKVFLVIFIIYVSSLVALPLTLRLAKHVEKHHLLAAGIAIQAVTYGAQVWVPGRNFPIVAALWVVNGIATAAAMTLPTSILADIIDHGEVIDGRRRSGTYVAVYNLVLKVGLALGVGVSFGLLELCQYDPSAAAYSPDDVRNIRLLGFGLPALLLLPVVALIWKHPITRDIQRRLRVEIDARSAAGRLAE